MGRLVGRNVGECGDTHLSYTFHGIKKSKKRII